MNTSNIWNGRKVMSFREVDNFFNQPKDTAKRTFFAHKSDFNEGEDYVFISRIEHAEKFTPGEKLQGNPYSNMVLLFETGLRKLTDIASATTNVKQLFSSHSSIAAVFDDKSEVSRGETNSLQVFTYNNRNIRTVLIDGEPWWVLKDVCDVLHLTTPAKVAERLDTDEKGVSLIHTLGGEQKMTIINESGLYSVILRSDKPEAKKFKRWVTHEVLPQIRKTGGYQRDEIIVENNGELSREERLKSMEQMSRCSATFYPAYIAMFRDVAPITFKRLFGMNTEIQQPLKLDDDKKNNNNSSRCERTLDKEKFRKLLSEKNVSYCELAELTGLPKSTCCNYWHGKVKCPSTKNATLIADTLNVSINYFLV